MDRGLNPHMQRIIENASGYAAHPELARSFECSSRIEEHRQPEWYYGSRTHQEPASFSPYDHAHFQRPHNPLPSATTGPSRVSLARRSAFAQSGNQPRTLSNADNHFRFAQNLRQGVRLSQPLPPRPNTQPMDTIGHLANAILMQRSLPLQEPLPLQIPAQIPIPEPDPANFFSGTSRNRLNQLQPQKQQITPPFNLSGFVYSPQAQQSGTSSSPSAGPHSSPSARFSLRRTATRPTPSSQYRQSNIVAEPDGEDPFVEGEILMPRTPVRQVSQPADYIPRPPTPIPSRPTPQSQMMQPTRYGLQSLALPHAPPMAHGIRLISPHELPDRFRYVFPYELFNAAQSKCFTPIYKTNDNVVVSAPTGSGKTAILELAICKLVEGHQSGMFKIVYLAPIKSLCSERLRDWSKKFSHLNLLCAELTGDTSQVEMSRVRSASIIVTTPEKWDSITRKWSDHAKLVQMVKLFLIDEVHILRDPRGATLEAIVSRMKKMSADVRFVALSATIPNSHDVALWLGKDHTNQHLPAHRETFGEDFRPVKLQKHVHGFDGLMNDFAFEKVLDGKLTGLIQKYTHKKPILVFCYTRKSCEQTANLLAEWWSRQRVVDRAWPTPTQKINVNSRDLSDLMNCGVAYHHAGLEAQDRIAVETGFLRGAISVICCTSTLAVGVNLPCHLVVLKGTVGFQDGKLGEYSDIEVMQMLGRAGRPQFDDSAVAVIMTRAEQQERYKKMISGKDTLESTLHLNFIELLNSEISLGTVKNVYEAKVWLNGTFLSVRMRQNPRYYKIDGIGNEGDTDQRLEKACERDIKLLQEHQLVKNKDQFTCSEYGEAMSRYMVKFDTMKLLLSIPAKAKTEQILDVVCQAAEFKDLKMKPAERPILREFNKSPFIKYQIKDTVTTTAHKVSLVIQVQLGGIDHPNDKDFNIIKRQFMVDKAVIFERVQRLIRCVIDCKLVDEDAIATRHALDLARSLSAEFWEYSNLQLRQIPQIGPAAVRKMVSNNISSIEKLDEKDAADIERILSKNPPFGKKIKDILAAFPRLELSCEIVSKAPFKQGKKPCVNVEALLGYKGVKTPIWNGKMPSLTFMAETSEGRIVHFWRGKIAKLEKGYELKFSVELSSPDEQIKCWIACDEIVGTVRSCILKPDVPVSHFPVPSTAHTEPSKPTEQAKPSRPNDFTTTNISRETDEFDDDGIADDELAAIVVQSIEKADTDYGSEDFADIDEVENMIKPKKTNRVNNKTTEKNDAPRMANGKYACNHACRDGQLLKNGKMCKHKCCNEGLDKPPTRKRKSSVRNDGPEDSSNKNGDSPSSSNMKFFKKPKLVKREPEMKFKSDKQCQLELQNVETVDLADRLSPVAYNTIAPREYRKLHALHTSVQGGRESTIRLLSKKKSQYSSTSQSQHELSSRQEKISEKDVFSFDVSSDDDFPTTAQLAGISEPDSYSAPAGNGLNTTQRDFHASNFEDDSLASLEAGIMELDDPVMRPAEPSKVDSSFANGVFDFDAFDDLDDDDECRDRVPTSSTKKSAAQEQVVRSSGMASEDYATYPTIDDLQEEAKHRRVSHAEQAQHASSTSHVPEWVNDMDPSLIDFLGDSVEYID